MDKDPRTTSDPFEIARLRQSCRIQTLLASDACTSRMREQACVDVCTGPGCPRLSQGTCRSDGNLTSPRSAESSWPEAAMRKYQPCSICYPSLASWSTEARRSSSCYSITPSCSQYQASNKAIRAVSCEAYLLSDRSNVCLWLDDCRNLHEFHEAHSEECAFSESCGSSPSNPSASAAIYERCL